MRKIFAIILLPALVHALAGAEPEFSGEADRATVETLRDEVRMLAMFFRTPWSRSGIKLAVVFSPAVPATGAEVQKSGGGYVLVLCGTPGGARYDFLLRSKLFSVLLTSAAGVPPTVGNGAILPPWLVAALEHRLRAGKHEERLLAGNRRAPVLRALAETGRIPEAGAVLRTDPRNFDPAARAWMEELSRVLLALGGRKVASAEFVRSCAARAAAQAAPIEAPFPIEDGKELQPRFAAALRRFAWHTLSPRPARWAVKTFAELRKVKLPVLDETGKPVPGKFEECDLAEIGEKLKDRPDAEPLAGGLKKRFIDFGPGDSRRVAGAIAELAELAGTANRPPFRYRAKLEQAIEKVLSELRRREKIDAYMREAEFGRAPAGRAFRRRLECADFYERGGSLLSAEGREWLDRREREFL